MHEVLVNRLGGLSLPRKSVVRLTDRPDMTLDVYRGRKTTIQQQQVKQTSFFCLLQHWECKLIVTLFTYTVAASLMWIFMEGLYLHMLVYKTLFTERHGIRLYVILGWGKFIFYYATFRFYC